jgi:hypothetical protein
MRRGQKTSAEQVVLKLRQIEVQTAQARRRKQRRRNSPTATAYSGNASTTSCVLPTDRTSAPSAISSAAATFRKSEQRSVGPSMMVRCSPWADCSTATCAGVS